MKYVTKEAISRILAPRIGKYTSTSWTTSHYPNPDAPEGLLHEEIEVDFNWDLNLTGSVLNCKFTNVTENWEIYNFNFDLSLLSGAPSQSLFILTDEFMQSNYDLISTRNNPDLAGIHNGETNGSDTVAAKDIENSFGRTLTSRKFRLFNNDTLISFFVVNSNPTPEDIVAIVIKPQTIPDQLNAAKATPDQIVNNTREGFNTSIIPNLDNWADHNLTIAGNLTKLQENPIGKIYEDLMSHINVGSHTIDGDIITVDFTTDDDIDFIYLEQVHGQLPRVKVPVTNKTGSFKIITTGMISGDEVEVKLGHRYWVNKESFKLVLP